MKRFFLALAISYFCLAKICAGELTGGIGNGDGWGLGQGSGLVGYIGSGVQPGTGGALLLEDGVSILLLEDATSHLCLEGVGAC